LAGKSRQLLDQLEEELRFFSDLGVDFVSPAAAKVRPKALLLHALEEKVLSCRLCPLAATRKLAVPGEGSYDSRLMFVGEAPGADEDVQGRPFVGRAGQLLTKIIEAMGFRRDEVYITNIVKCRPPDNRTPLHPEIQSCRGYLLVQIEAIAPKIIVTLGKVATNFFLPSAAGMSALRGTFHRHGEILVMPTFHPSYLIRNEGDKGLKKLVWQDMRKVMAALGKK